LIVLTRSETLEADAGIVHAVLLAEEDIARGGSVGVR
jgi:hypothetical protein